MFTLDKGRFFFHVLLVFQVRRKKSDFLEEPMKFHNFHFHFTILICIVTKELNLRRELKFET